MVNIEYVLVVYPDVWPMMMKSRFDINLCKYAIEDFSKTTLDLVSKSKPSKLNTEGMPKNSTYKLFQQPTDSLQFGT